MKQTHEVSNRFRSIRRVLAVTDDEGVRIISAITGETLNILFPMFSGPVSTVSEREI